MAVEVRNALQSTGQLSPMIGGHIAYGRLLTSLNLTKGKQ